MSTAPTLYGDISPEVAGSVSKQLLERGMPTLIADQFGQSQALKEHGTTLLNFFRYNALPSDPTELVEGVSPAGRKLTRTKISVRVKQYGDFVPISDVVLDTADDTVLQGAIDVLSQQSAEMSEKIILNELKAGTNVVYAGNVASRSLVASVFSDTELKRVVRVLLKQNAGKVTSRVRSTAAYGMENVHPAFIALVPAELISAVRALTGFVDAKDYGQISPYPTEIGAWNEIRFLYHTLLTGWADTGSGTAGGTLLSTTGTNCDVFPIVIFGANAWANVALRGEFAITPTVRNPKPAPGDELGQTGSVGWKMMKAAKILNDAFMARVETAAPV